jgi:hypothetical protein
MEWPALPTREEPLVLTVQEAKFGRYRETKSILPLPGTEPRFLGRPACSTVAIPTELSRLTYIC